MPSSHSQFIGFFCAFFLSHFYLHHPKAAVPRTLVNTMRRFEHLFAMLAIAGLTVATCYSRYHLSYHTTLQIFVGLFVGLVIGFVYYYLTEYLPRQPLRLPGPFRSAVDSPVSSPVRGPSRSTSLRQRSRTGINDPGRSSERASGSSQSATASASSPPAAPPRQSSLKTHRRRSSLSSLLKTELYPAPPIRQLILDHPLAVAFRLRDSWTVWLDGGIEGEYEAWRSEWERRRKPYPSDWKRGAGHDQQQQQQQHTQRLNSIAEKLDGFMLDGPGERSAAAEAKGGVAMLSGGPSSSGSGSEAYSQDLDTNFAADTKSNFADAAAGGAAGAVPTTSATTPLRLMKLALRQASRCEPTSTAFCVGCIIAISGTEQIVATGFSRELEGNTHAEQCALDKAVPSSSSGDGGGGLAAEGKVGGEEAQAAQAQVVELDLYTTMEPCSERLSGATPCAQRILAFNKTSPLLFLPPSSGGAASLQPRKARARIVRVYQGVSEPEDFIKDNVGLKLLRSGGIEVVRVVEGEQRREGEEGGWIEREALRLAKWGHEDQAREREGESRFWKEAEG